MIATDWDIARAALQVLAEERHGEKVREIQSAEDAAFAAAKRALGG